VAFDWMAQDSERGTADRSRGGPACLEADVKGYVIAEVEVTDPAGFEEYRALVPGSLEAYGGRFVVRGGQVASLEGGWEPKRLVILEFDSFDQARAWYESDQYGPARELRQRTANTRLILVEGVG
jgi:uncharacterized protein (DUF1330 family)